MQLIIWHSGPIAGRRTWLICGGAAGASLIVLILAGALITSLLPWVLPALSVGIDAGHGGIDPGAIGPSGVQEKNVTLPLAQRVAQLLQAADIPVYLTRHDDNRLDTTHRSDLQARVKLAGEHGVDIFISIHTNSFSDRRVSGPRTYYQPGSAEGERLAAAIQSALREAAGQGAKLPVAEDHLVTRETAMPAVIVEVGYISNYEDERLLQQASYQNKLAAAIVEGILNCYPPE